MRWLSCGRKSFTGAGTATVARFSAVQWFGQLAGHENQPWIPLAAPKDRISCLRFSLEDAAPKGTTFMD